MTCLDLKRRKGCNEDSEIARYNQDVYMKTFTGKVLSCRKEQDQDRYEVVLDQTAFFPGRRRAIRRCRLALRNRR